MNQTRTPFFKNSWPHGGHVLTYMLHEIYDRVSAGAWYVTSEGGAYCAATAVADSYDACILGQGTGHLHLPDGAAVAEFVYHAAIGYLKRPITDHEQLVFDKTLRALVALAIFPEYKGIVGTHEPSATAVDNLLRAFQESGVPSPHALFAKQLFLWGMGLRNRIEFSYILCTVAERHAGALVAHGICQEEHWGLRHLDVLRLGCDYQLSHPQEDFRPRLEMTDYPGQKPIIEYLTAGAREDWLSTVGIPAKAYKSIQTAATALAERAYGPEYVGHILNGLHDQRTGLCQDGLPELPELQLER